MSTVAEVMAQLADSARQPTASVLSRLSDLSAGDAQRFEELWPGLGVVRRRQIIQQMVAQAEVKIDLNFHRVLKACLKDTDATVRLQAIQGLWECREPSLIEPLIGLLYHDPAPAVRGAVAQALGSFVLLAELGKLPPRYGAQLEEALRRAFEDDSQPLEVRQPVLESIAYFSQSRVFELIEQAHRGSQPEMRLSAIRAMGRNLDSHWLDTLLLELGSSEAEMRREAALACGQLGEARAIPYLAELIAEDKDLEVQRLAIHALGEIGGKRAIHALAPLLTHPREAVRLAARKAVEAAQFLDDPLSVGL